MQQVQLVQQPMTCRPRTLTWPDIGGVAAVPRTDGCWANHNTTEPLVAEEHGSLFEIFSQCNYAKTWCSSGVLSGNPNQNMLVVTRK